MVAYTYIHAYIHTHIHTRIAVTILFYFCEYESAGQAIVYVDHRLCPVSSKLSDAAIINSFNRSSNGLITPLKVAVLFTTHHVYSYITHSSTPHPCIFDLALPLK